MLRAIPVECCQMQPEDAFELRPVVRHRDEFGQRWVGIERKGFNVCVDLEARAVRLVHEEQTHPIIGRKVAGADVLAVAPIVGERKRTIIDYLEKATWTASMLDVGPTRLRNRRHVEAVTIGNERRFVLSETIELAVPLEVLPDAIRAHLGLYGPNAGRHGDIEESV